jgi:3-methyladenine DNA glycosylase AlkD
MSQEEIQKRLETMGDPAYGAFMRRLIPGVMPETVIGIRTPALRKYAAELFCQPEKERFLRDLPHRFFEENNLHGFVIARIRDFGEALEETERFLPFVDNWATCDQLTPKALGRNLPVLLEHIRVWLRSDEPYTVRFGIGMLMRYYLEDAFTPEFPELVAAVRSEEYYVRMMVAWYFATALAKQYDAVLPYLEQRKLERWTHNKTIQKAVESFRITAEQKAYLRTLRIK